MENVSNKTVESVPIEFVRICQSLYMQKQKGLLSFKSFIDMHNWIICTTHNQVETMKRLLSVLNQDTSQPKHVFMEDPTLICFVICFLVLILFGTIGNLLVIYVVAIEPKLRTPRNVFIVNLAISDLFVCMLSQPFNLLKILVHYQQWFLGDGICRLSGLLQYMNIFVSTISITAIALDRFQVIVYPTRTSVKKLGILVSICSIWLISGIMASPALLFLRVQRHVMHNYLICMETGNDKEHTIFIYTILAFIFQYIVPMIILTIAYARISLRIRYRMLNKSHETPQNTNSVTRLNSPGNSSLSLIARIGQIINHWSFPVVTRNTPIAQTPLRPEQNSRIYPSMLQQSVAELSQLRQNEDTEASGQDLRGKYYCFGVFLCCKKPQKPMLSKVNYERHRQRRTNILLFSLALIFALSWLPLNINNIQNHYWASELHKYEVSSSSFTNSSTNSNQTNDPINTNQKVVQNTISSNPKNPKNVSVTHTSATQPTNNRVDEAATEKPSHDAVAAEKQIKSADTMHTIFLLITGLTSMINPILYGWLNENFNKQFKQMRIFRLIKAMKRKCDNTCYQEKRPLSKCCLTAVDTHVVEAAHMLLPTHTHSSHPTATLPSGPLLNYECRSIEHKSMEHHHSAHQISSEPDAKQWRENRHQKQSCTLSGQTHRSGVNAYTCHQLNAYFTPISLNANSDSDEKTRAGATLQVTLCEQTQLNCCDLPGIIHEV